jgi:hypothetical protein
MDETITILQKLIQREQDARLKAALRRALEAIKRERRPRPMQR